jgi:hypothetical protein
MCLIWEVISGIAASMLVVISVVDIIIERRGSVIT